MVALRERGGSRDELTPKPEPKPCTLLLHRYLMNVTFERLQKALYVASDIRALIMSITCELVLWDVAPYTEEGDWEVRDAAHFIRIFKTKPKLTYI